MIVGDVCTGISAASCAWHPLGWKSAFFSEIEPFPSKVLAHHYPTVPNLGDMTKFQEWPDYDIDVLVGGTPCQSFSVAGLRKGLADPRGNLMLTYLAIANKYRPKWLVWENVPGVLSSNGGKDFGTLLGGMGELGYGFAYRVLDAQYFGVPQRRRRVFVVGHLGDWRRAAAVLFERHSLQGHPAPSRKAGQEVTGPLMARTTAGGGFGGEFECAGGLQPVDDIIVGNAEGACDMPFLTRSNVGKHVNNQTPLIVFNKTSAVRRLTPRECERLQGFPDDYTLIQVRGKPAADGPRYKALGNSMAVPVMAWIGQRIQMVSELKIKSEKAA